MSYKIKQVGDEIWIYDQYEKFVFVKLKNWKEAFTKLLTREVELWADIAWEEGVEIQEVDLMDSGLIENDYCEGVKVILDDFEIGNVKG